MKEIESFCASCPHIGDCDISGSTKAMKCPYVVRAGVKE
jgi:hypothetical protein